MINKKHTIHQEGVILVVDEMDDVVAVVRKNGKLTVLKTEPMGFEEIYEFLCDTAGQGIVDLAALIPHKLPVKTGAVK